MAKIMKYGRQRVLKVSQEVDMGTAVAGATYLQCYEPDFNPTSNLIQREFGRSHSGAGSAALGPQIGQCKFRTELRSDGAGALNAALLICWQACGLKLDAGVLSPVTEVTDMKTITIDGYFGGKLKRLYGAMGTWEVSGEAGAQVFIEFTFSGLYAIVADAAMPAVAEPAVGPMMARAATLTLDAYTPYVGKFSLASNAVVEAREDIESATGILHYVITGRRYVAGLDPEIDESANFDPDTDWAAGTEAALSLELADATTTVTIEAPTMQYDAPQDGVRGTKAIHTLQGQCNMDDGDDEISITAAAVA